MKLFFAFIFSLLSLSLFAQEGKVPARPNPPKLVNDFTNTLTPAQVQALESKLVAYDDSTSNQIAVVIINSLDGYDIADYALKLGREWGIGGKEFSNGVLLLVAIADHKIRIEVGYGLEGAIPDITAKHIIEEAITPAFKEENYYRGIDRGTDDIIRAAAGEYKAPANYGKKKTRTGFGAILGLIILFIILGAMGGGRSSGGTMSGAGWIIGTLINSAGRRGGWGGGGGGWSGGGGGGGFGGFGGGSFGGGGASGSW
jgi:uncharacterized protein